MGRDESDRRSKVASILAMGTANPATVVEQSAYPDLFFKATSSDHLVELKNKFRRICEHSGIKQRHLHFTEDVLSRYPDLCSDTEGPSLATRQLIASGEVASLGAQAARRALDEWGCSTSEITHLIVATSNGVRMPGADLAVAKLLGLKSSVSRLLLNQLGCSAGGTAIRVGKAIAEAGGISTRVMIVCSEVAAFTFRPPSEKHSDRLVGSAVMGDGAAAFIIGLTNDDREEPLFDIQWSGQFFIPDTEDDLAASLTENGLVYFLSKRVPGFVSSCVQDLLPDALGQAPVNVAKDELFWAVHPGGRAILDQIERKLELPEDALAATRETLADFGNMSSSTVMFVLDRLRRRSQEMGCATHGEGHEWGILLSFGPGLTVEMQLLRARRRKSL